MFEIVIISGAICGVLMVVGGMVLLAIGAIQLDAAGKGDQASPEAMILEFKKTVKVTTHYPALALFLIGVLFICASAWFSKPGKVEPWSILGKIDSPDPAAVTVAVTVDLSTLNPNYDGTIDSVIYPNLDRFKAVIHAPGCNPETQNQSLKVKDAKRHILELTAASVHKVIEKPPGLPPPGKENIEKLPANVQLPPVTESGKF